MEPLTTLGNCKEYLGIKDDVSDNVLTRLIDAASTFLRTVLSRDITSETYSEKRSGNGGRWLMMRNYPVTDIASVVIDNVNIPLSVSGSPGYVFDEYQITLIGFAFSRGMMNVVVDYTAGYTEIPADIEQACIDLVGLKFKEKDRVGIESKTLATETVTFKRWDLTSTTKQMLKQYQRVMPV